MELHIATPPVTWVLVADAKTAQIYVPARVERRLPLMGNSRHCRAKDAHTLGLAPILVKPLTAESVKNYEIGRNKTGMVFESFSSARHVATPHVDAHKEIKQQFAKRIADFVAGAKMGSAFDRLVLVAPPVMLGEIVGRLPANIQCKITAKVAKEFTHESPEKLAQRLAEYAEYY